MVNRDRFIRWQAILREQLTFLNGLVLTLSIGILGFIFSFLDKSEFNLVNHQKFFFTLGLILIVFSVIGGLTTAFCRLLDFRKTTEKIRQESLNKGKNVIAKLKKQMKLYGKVTWVLFYLQIITISLGTISLMIAFCCIYKDKLF